MSSFWTNADDRHQEIAKTYYQGIEYTHPDTISSDGQGCSYLHEDSWSASSVKYYTYNGPRVTNI